MAYTCSVLNNYSNLKIKIVINVNERNHYDVTLRTMLKILFCDVSFVAPKTRAAFDLVADWLKVFIVTSHVLLIRDPYQQRKMYLC